MIRLTRKKGRFLNTIIQTWQNEGVITDETRKQLESSYKIIPFDWKRLAKYAFWAAVICIVTSISAILADEALLILIFTFFQLPEIFQCVFFAAVAGGFYYLGLKRKRKYPEKVFSNEAVFLLGVLCTAASIGFLGAAFETDDPRISNLILIGVFIYGALGLMFPSTLVWVFALLSAGSWLGAETGYVSGWGAYYLGMNFPLRFVLFGLLVTAVSTLLGYSPKYAMFKRSTRIMGLLYLFISLWIMSIFGNYGDMATWWEVKPIELFHWSLLYFAAAAASIYHGVKYDDGMTRGFGLTFLFLNLYTRFFEFFWNTTHKAIFFAILGISFWYLGTRAEKIWNLSRLPGLDPEKNEISDIGKD